MRQRTLLGHIIREPRDSLMRKPTITENLERPQRTEKRVGRPRDKWLEDTLDRTYWHLYQESSDVSNQTHVDNLINDARNRK